MTEQCFKTSVARITRTAALLGASLLIASCASGVACHPSVCGSTGGGGGGGGHSPVVTPFTSFTGVQASVPTSVPAITREGSYAVDGTGAVLAHDVASPTEGTGSASFTINSSKEITVLSITGAQSNVGFNGTNSTAYSLFLDGQAIATAASSNDDSKQAVYGDPYVTGFDYQTFGVWVTGFSSGSSGKYGAGSVGAPTSVSAVPPSGNATFSGYVGGIFAQGSVERYAADATFDVNFANRTVDLSSSNPTLTSINTGNTISVGYPVITGTMTYSVGSSNFSGDLSATGQVHPLSGTGSGIFYGPSASELGGTFFLRESGAVLVGGFSGRR